MTEKRKMTMDEVHTVLFDMLCFIDDVCKKNGIVYFLSGGSALGAVREKGFIPWDDDIDIMLPRPDYEKLQTVSCELNNKDYIFMSLEDTGWDRMYACLVNKHTQTARTMRRYCMTGITIDLFPMDGLPDSIRKTRQYYQCVRWKYFLYNSAMRVSFREDEKYKWLKKLLLGATRKINVNKICLNIDRHAKSRKYEDSNYVGCSVLEHYMEKEWFKKEWFDKQVYMVFEGKHFPVMNGYDQYLTQLYGDYMIQKNDQGYPEGVSQYYWISNQSK